MKDSSAPSAPDPAVSIPLQGAENRKTFDYQLGQMRTGSSDPYGSTSWTKTPTFDQAGFDKAMAGFTPGQQGTWVPETQGWDGSGDGGNAITTPGHWSGASGPVGKEPNKEDFTTYNWTQETKLSPEQQAIFDANQKSQLGTANLLGGLTENATNAMSSPMDFSNLPGLATGMGEELSGYRDKISGLDPAQFNQQLSDAMYNSSARYLDPQIQQQQQALDARLAEQGFVPGTPGYQQAMDTFNQSKERSYADARDRSVIGGTQAGSTAFGNQLSALQSAMSGGLSAGNLQNQTSAQALAQALQQRNQPINELNAIRSGQQVNMPSGGGTSSTPNLGATDILGQLGQQYQGQLGAYGANTASNNSLYSGLGSALTMLLMGSDRRLKKDITRIGTTEKGNGWYTWNWRSDGSPGFGVIAQEVLDPSAVHVGPDGFLLVDYSKV